MKSGSYAFVVLMSVVVLNAIDDDARHCYEIEASVMQSRDRWCRPE